MCPQEMPHAPRGMALPDDNVLAGPCAPACTITYGSGLFLHLACFSRWITGKSPETQGKPL